MTSRLRKLHTNCLRGVCGSRACQRGQPPKSPIALISDVIQNIGPHDLDLTGALIKGDGLAQGPFDRYPSVPTGAAFPCLWNHDAKRERQLIVEPDSHCQIRTVGGTVPDKLVTRAGLRWDTAARAHYNRDLRFNSQSLIVAMTPRQTLGGRAWPTVVFEDKTHAFAFALWSNSTLGLLCHWWMANKSQAGRGTSSVTSIPTYPTLDLRALTVDQHSTAKAAFEAIAQNRLLPFDQINEDPVRAELDELLLVEILGLPSDLCVAGGPIERLRAKLAAEPQVHSDKKTRIVFTGNGETSTAR